MEGGREDEFDCSGDFAREEIVQIREMLSRKVGTESKNVSF